MPIPRGISPSGSKGRLLFLTGLVLLGCILLFSGCTQPVIPTPSIAQTTPVPAATTRAATPAPVTTSQVTMKLPDYVTYTNPQWGFSLSYPSGWTKQENAGTAVVVFTSPGDTPATMRISIIDLSSTPMSLEQFKTAQIAKKAGLDLFNLIYDQAHKGNGFTGWKIAYTGNPGQLTEWVEVYAIKGTNGYILSFSSKEDKYASVVVPMDNMFKSFQLS
jgi:hypothetical protein